MRQWSGGVHKKYNRGVPKTLHSIYKKFLKLKNHEKTPFLFCKMYDILISTFLISSGQPHTFPHGLAGRNK